MKNKTFKIIIWESGNDVIKIDFTATQILIDVGHYIHHVHRIYINNIINPPNTDMNVINGTIAVLVFNVLSSI